MTKVKIRFKVYEIPENDPYGIEKWYTRTANFENFPKLYSSMMIAVNKYLEEKVISAMPSVREVERVTFDIVL